MGFPPVDVKSKSQEVDTKASPEIVDTDKNWMGNDLYVAFIGENIERAYMSDCKTIDVSQVLTALNVYGAFRQWCRDNCPNTKVPDARIVKALLQDNRCLGPIIAGNRGWIGIKFIG